MWQVLIIKWERGSGDAGERGSREAGKHGFIDRRALAGIKSGYVVRFGNFSRIS
jgi:hypothetical protein